MSLRFLLLLILVLAHGDLSAQELKKYVNERFGFAMTYPSDFEMDPPPDNGDGSRFTKSASCVVLGFAYYNVLNETLRSHSRSTKANFDKVKRRVFGPNWVSYSGVVGGKLLYIKSFVGTVAINELRIEQPSSGKPCAVDVVRVANSFVPGVLNDKH